MIYTKKGDQGTTGLLGTKKRLSKASKTICALGAIDEANSYLGTLRMGNKLIPIQKNLILVSSILAGAKVKLPEGETERLEREIDELEQKRPPLQKLILPRGPLMYARALVRRAEREVVGVGQVEPTILKYVNRLSDYLFMLARRENFTKG